ncbi:MAG: inner rane transporter permease protein YejB, partial [Methylobacterium brachiatum]|nr:inner rane transporter permease protein YejB [Methylobacterium brachiatum]
MLGYILRRIGLMIPTLFGIMLITFTIVQFAPGGPVERVLSQMKGQGDGTLSRVTGGGGDLGGGRAAGGGEGNSRYRGAQGLSPDFIAKLEKQFGFDKPAPERFAKMLWDYVRFDFGRSYFRDVTVIQLIKERLPVSISLG